jgi:multidrug efflux pump subunit AcrA (membrane-fusion protein)
MWKWLTVVLALIGAGLAIRLSLRSVTPDPIPPPLQEPVRNPYPKALAGAGVVEPEGENVIIGVPEPGRVEEVFVTKGQAVKAGAPLFRLDDRALKAELVAAQAAVVSAEAELARVKAYRRKEDEPGLRAKVAEATASVGQARQSAAEARASIQEQEWAVKDAETHLKRVEVTAKANASPEEDLDRARYALEMARARLQALRERAAALEAGIAMAQAKQQEAEADLNIYLAGPWAPDVQKADAAVAEAQARVERLRLLLARLTVAAPLDAIVLRCDLRAGEYYPAATPEAEKASIVLGRPGPLCVRVDIDEFDARRFKPGMPATALLKGANDQPLSLEFVRVEPFIVPKRALTNSQRELVDTRVLQVIYRITTPNAPVYVGQQVNVFVEEKDGGSPAR